MTDKQPAESAAERIANDTKTIIALLDRRDIPEDKGFKDTMAAIIREKYAEREAACKRLCEAADEMSKFIPMDEWDRWQRAIADAKKELGMEKRRNEKTAS